MGIKGEQWRGEGADGGGKWREASVLVVVMVVPEKTSHS